MDNILIVKVLNEDGKKIGYTYLKKAKNLVKKNKAKLIDDDTICMINDAPSSLDKILIPKYTLAEELLSSISHGVGALMSIAFLVLCIVFSSLHHNTYAIISSSIYGFTSIVLYVMSCLYHSFKVNKAKKLFRIFDHSSIYLLIAGTYTPYALVTMRSASTALGWSVFGIIWACAILGITFTSIDMNKFKKMGMALYIIMGWLIVFTFKTLINNLNINAIYLMVLAGIIYTIGAILYGIGKKKKYFHFIFHMFVLIASILFFFSIFLYVI